MQAVIHLCRCGAEAIGMFYDGRTHAVHQMCDLCLHRGEMDGLRLVTLYDWTPGGRYHEMHPSAQLVLWPKA